MSLGRCVSEAEEQDTVNRCSPLLSGSVCCFGCLVEMLVTPSDYHILFGGGKQEKTGLGRIPRASAFQITVPLFNCKLCHSCLEVIFQSEPQWNSPLPFPFAAPRLQEPWGAQEGQPWCSAVAVWMSLSLCSVSVRICSEPVCSCTKPSSILQVQARCCSPALQHKAAIVPCSPAPHRQIGSGCAANVGQSALTLLERAVGSRPACSLSNCNFSRLKSVPVAACQEQGHSLLWV